MQVYNSINGCYGRMMFTAEQNSFTPKKEKLTTKQDSLEFSGWFDGNPGRWAPRPKRNPDGCF
jgi:hypothetical protein